MARRSPKARGTAFESDTRDWLRERLGQPGIERSALHGSRDQGDLCGLSCGALSGIVECKTRKASIGPKLLREFEGQTARERENAGAGFALLVIHRAGVGRARFGQNRCLMQGRDVMAVSGQSPCGPDEWTELTLEEACQLIERSDGV